jgi:hypothetical protein
MPAYFLLSSQAVLRYMNAVLRIRKRICSVLKNLDFVRKVACDVTSGLWSWLVIRRRSVCIMGVFQNGKRKCSPIQFAKVTCYPKECCNRCRDRSEVDDMKAGKDDQGGRTFRLNLASLEIPPGASP